MIKIFIVFLLTALFIEGYGQNEKKENSTLTINGVSHSMNIDSARVIAKKAWIYGYPMFYNYKTIYL